MKPPSYYHYTELNCQQKGGKGSYYKIHNVLYFFDLKVGTVEASECT